MLTMSNQARSTRIPRRAAQMDERDLSPLTVKRCVILDKPRRHDTQVSDTSLARASAVMNSPHGTPLVTPNSSASSRQKVHQQLLLQHFANLDIEMIYQAGEEEEAEEGSAAQARYNKERSTSIDMSDVFYSEH